MKKLSGNLVGIGLVALAASVVGVGAVWATGGAFFGGDGGVASRAGTTDSSVPADDRPDGDLPPVSPDDPGTGDDLDELKKMVADLSDQVETLSTSVTASVERVDTVEKLLAASAEKVDRAEKKVASVADDFDDLDARVTKGLVAIEGVAGDVATAKQDAADALAQVTSMSATVAVLERRTAKLGEDGNYIGPVNPSQFTRRLTTADITGNWPLNRVSEKLRTDYLEVNGSGCTADFRFNTVLVVNAFRWVECVRIAK